MHSCAQCRAPCRALQKAQLPSTTVDLTTDRDARDYVMSLGYLQAPVVAGSGTVADFAPKPSRPWPMVRPDPTGRTPMFLFTIGHPPPLSASTPARNWPAPSCSGSLTKRVTLTTYRGELDAHQLRHRRPVRRRDRADPRPAGIDEICGCQHPEDDHDEAGCTHTSVERGRLVGSTIPHWPSILDGLRFR